MRAPGTNLIHAALCAAILPALPMAAAGGRSAPDSGWIRSLDTSWQSPFWTPGLPGQSLERGTGTGPSATRGLGGSGGSDTGYLKGDTLWSSPYEGPATPGTGMPGRPGSGLNPGTGGTGIGGSGAESREIPRDSLRVPRTPPTPSAPSDSIGSFEWMERG